ncbi:MAG: spore coat protein CotJB [bacterium]|nr:spore coat protein CotJB [bacterium]
MCEEEKLLQFIREVSFAVTDVGLYLDTHPCDRYALKYYAKYKELRERALEEYQKEYGPLLVDGVESCDYWTWVEDPWPWKGGK